MPVEAPIFPFDWHTPSSVFSDHSLQWWPNNELHLAPGRCEMAHSSLNPPVFVVGIDLTDRGNSQEVWVLLVIHHTHTEPVTQHPNPTPFTQTHSHRSEFTALTLPTSPSVQVWLQQGAFCTIGLLSTITGVQFSEQREAPRTTAAWGAACHVSPNTTSDSPARVSFAGTGKDNTTCPGIPTVLVSVGFLYTEHMSCPWLPFVILDSALQLEGILGISQGLSSGVKQRLWILGGQGQDHMVIQDSPRVVPE